jgi:hypothetical protein
LSLLIHRADDSDVVVRAKSLPGVDHTPCDFHDHDQTDTNQRGNPRIPKRFIGDVIQLVHEVEDISQSYR